jgi:histidine triad (HIT) family protein
VHLLVLPKSHVETLNDLNDEKTMAELFLAVQGATKKLGVSDYRTVINTGREAGQEVFHLHLHVLAGRAFVWPPG